MAASSPAARTRTVETKTIEQVPVNPDSVEGLGMSCLEYLETVSDEELEITSVKVYRDAPKADGYLIKVTGERIDEDWIDQRFGGGVYSIRVSSKSGKSGYQRNISIEGQPKNTDKPAAPAAASPTVAAAAAPDTSLERVIGLLDKTIERFERLQSAQPASNVAQDSAVEIMTSAAKKAIEVAASANPKPAAESNLDADLQRLKLMKEIFQGANTEPKEDEFTKQLKQAFITKLLKEPEAPHKSLAEELKGLGEIKELLGWGGEGGGRPEHWTSKLIDAAPAVLDRLVTAAQARAEAAGADLERVRIVASARGTARPPAPPPTPMPVQTSANAPAAVPAAPAPGAGGFRMTAIDEHGAPPAAAEPSLEGLNTEAPEFVQFVKERIVSMVHEGASGAEIVGFLEGVRQGQVIQMLMDHTDEAVATFMRADPILTHAVNHPNWADTLDEVREWVNDQADEEPKAPTKIN